MTSHANAEWASERLRCQRAELSRVMEPGDLLASVTIDTLGTSHTHQLVFSGRNPTGEEQHSVTAAAEEAGLHGTRSGLLQALQRWRTRTDQADGQRDLRVLHRLGGGLIIPEDPAWPNQLNELYPAAPVALYFRGPSVEAGTDPQRNYHYALQHLPTPPRSIAVVGSREATDYGTKTAFEVAQQLAENGVGILSGGAYGIDAAAHRGALTTEPQKSFNGPTHAVLAGGVDRFYPAGNEGLLRAVADSGLLLGEMAPGSTPTRHRFLHRNRLIAALAAAIVVVEARWRSGALSTAHHGLGLGRPVGAFPGSIYSASSAGCHRLLRDSPAQLVTDAADILELVTGAAGLEQPLLQLPHSAVPHGETQQTDHLSEVDLRLFDALPAKRSTTAGKLCGVAGVPLPQVLAALSRLQRRGLAEFSNGHWSRIQP